MTDQIRPKDLLALRRAGAQRRFAPAALAPTVAAAYDTAAAAIGLMGAPVVAWKLGASTAATRKLFATDEIYYGALIAAECWNVSAGGPVPAPPKLMGEAEIVLRLSRDIPAGEALPEGLQPFDAWAPAVEAPWSCIEDIPGMGLRALLSDRCAAGALYLGPVSTDLADAAIDAPLEIVLDGAVVASGAAPTGLVMSPQAAALAFISVAGAQGVSLSAGQWISTGGITPCVPLAFDRPVGLRHGGREMFTIEVPAPHRGASA